MRSDKPWEIFSTRDNTRRDDAGTSAGWPIDLTMDFVFRPVFRVSFFSGFPVQESPEIRLEDLPVLLRV